MRVSKYSLSALVPITLVSSLLCATQQSACYIMYRPSASQSWQSAWVSCQYDSETRWVVLAAVGLLLCRPSYVL